MDADKKVKDSAINLFRLADMEKPGEHYVLFRIQRNAFPSGGSAVRFTAGAIQYDADATCGGPGRYCSVIRSRSER